MTLEEYQKKRDFTKSPEPTGEIKVESKRNNVDNIGNGIGNGIRSTIFVIHEHHSSRLHWDLRLEIGDVLRSWAVPKDPIDVNNGSRRLAIQVEDHPVEYAIFEGDIPTGMYGAGTVKIWDNGDFNIEDNIIDKLIFELKGKKMNGRYALIYVPNMGENSWLFIKKK